MSELPVCRVCLLNNLKMKSIQSTQLLEMFELLANNKLITEDGRPDTICYICYSQLQRCHKLMEVSRIAEKILTQLFCNGLKVTQEAVTMLNGGTTLINAPTIQPVSFHNFPIEGNLKVEYGLTEVKQEGRYSTEFEDVGSPGDVKSDLAEDCSTFCEDMNLKALTTSEIKEENTEVLERNNHIFIASNNVKGEKIVDQSCIENVKTPIRRKKNTDKKIKLAFLRNNKHKPFKTHRRHTHKNRSTPINPFACKFCEKILSDKYDLSRHIRTHTGEKPFTCTVCGKSYSNRYVLKRHTKIHSGERPCVCNICGKSFPENSDVKKHMRIHTDEKSADAAYAGACDRCGKTFFDKGVLKKHMRIHTGEKPFVCDMCDKTFAEKGNLKRHIRIHTEEKPYACDMCDKSFSESGNLKTHMRIHTGEKPYSCDACGKSFALSNSLKKHFTTHTGERQFSCVICFKTFTAKNSLKIHMRIHSGEKPYSCNICSKSFYESSSLRRHKRTHTGEKPYTCIECNKSFSRKAYLQQHVAFCKR